MTLEEFRSLKVGDIVFVNGNNYEVTCVTNYDMYVFRCVNFPCIIISVDNLKNISSFKGWFKSPISKQLSEKEVLEIQLKEAEEQVQKESARVDSIKAKLEELSKPKLKIGGLYSFKWDDEIRLGVLYVENDSVYKIIDTNLSKCQFVKRYVTKATFKEITNPKYSHIGPTILEFMKLNPENFK